MNRLLRRARATGVLAVLVGGISSLLASTQPWMLVTLADGNADTLEVVGSEAVALFAPLSLAALALGLALTIVGRVLRYIFGVVAVALGIGLTAAAASALPAPLGAYATAVTEATGLGGVDAIASLVDHVAVTGWPVAALIGGILVATGGVWTLATARSWGSGGRRYDATTATAPSGSRPHDAIDDWDDLSRGTDPTT